MVHVSECTQRVVLTKLSKPLLFIYPDVYCVYAMFLCPRSNIIKAHRSLLKIIGIKDKNI